VSATSAAPARDRAWAVLAIERREGVAHLRGTAQSLVAQAMVAASIPEIAVVPGGAPNAVVLAFPAATPVRDVAVAFPGALRTVLRACNEGRDPRDRVRITVAFDHAAADRPSAVALRIAEAPVLARVRAETWDAELVVAVSEAWYDEWDPPTEGLSHVRSGGDTFWIGVPGRLAPLGLVPADVVSRPDATVHVGHFRRFPRSPS